MKQYKTVMNRYFEFADQHDFKITGFRQTPLFTNNGPSNPPQYDFIERWVSSYKETGKGWKKLLDDPEGQKIMADWSEVGTCYRKLSSGYALHLDAEAMSNDDNRIVMWNWCGRKDGILWDNISQHHQNLANDLSGEIPYIAWLLYYPQIGSVDAPGEFAHVFVYPDMDSLMAERDRFNNKEGWRIQDNYYSTYADCQGDSVMTEEVIYQPNNN